MKFFCFHIIKILILLILSLYALDYIYTEIYSQAKYRNKIQYALNNNPEVYDVIFLGSSRANNHFVTSEFEKKGLKSFNFGISGSSLEESLLLLEILIEKKNRINNVLLEIDLNIKDQNFSEGTRAFYMPYLNNKLIVNNYYQSEMEDFKLYSNFPFYRYIKNETKIGYREMLFTYMNRKSKIFDSNGYTPLYGSNNDLSYDLTNTEPTRNKYYEEIKQICKKYNIKLIVVMTPMCTNTKGLDYFEKVKQLYPEIHNFENVVNDDKYFSSCGHLNEEGAIKFTRVLLDRLKFN